MASETPRADGAKRRRRRDSLTISRWSRRRSVLPRGRRRVGDRLAPRPPRQSHCWRRRHRDDGGDGGDAARPHLPRRTSESGATPARRGWHRSPSSSPVTAPSPASSWPTLAGRLRRIGRPTAATWYTATGGGRPSARRPSRGPTTTLSKPNGSPSTRSTRSSTGGPPSGPSPPASRCSRSTAHGYLRREFCSPVTDDREDGYGGDFEGRTWLLREVVEAARSTTLDGTALFVRVSATDWLAGPRVVDRRGLGTTRGRPRAARGRPDRRQFGRNPPDQ